MILTVDGVWSKVLFWHVPGEGLLLAEHQWQHKEQHKAFS